MRESGFDTSFRFGPFSGSTNHYAPVCLNSLLYKYETDMAHFATLLGRTAETAQWNQRASMRQGRHQQVSLEPRYCACSTTTISPRISSRPTTI